VRADGYENLNAAQQHRLARHAVLPPARSPRIYVLRQSSEAANGSQYVRHAAAKAERTVAVYACFAAYNAVMQQVRRAA